LWGEEANAIISLTCFDSDGVFCPATARIEADTLIVSSPTVPEPRYVRYAWANYPAANLYNAAGLPASPFTSYPLP
jgi:sialate O-acetylesterase